jgi:hypothetical protein
VRTEEIHGIVVKARNIIDEGGLCKGILQIGDMHCIGGAINRAHHGNSEWCGWDQYYKFIGWWQEGEIQEITQAIANANGFRWQHVGDMIMWNNHPSRTKEQVLEALDKTAIATAPLPAVPKLSVPEEELVNA